MLDKMGCCSSKRSGFVVVLQGSSTYLAKAVGTDGKCVSIDEFKKSISKMYKAMDEGTDAGKEVDQTNLANGLFAESILRVPGATDGAGYVVAKRVFTAKDGVTIYTQLWAGYVAEELCSEEGQRFVFVDVGSGELKYFAVTVRKKASPDDYPFEAVEIAKEEELAEEFFAKFGEVAGGSKTPSELKNILVRPLETTEYKELKVIAVATQAARDIKAAHGAKADDVLNALGESVSVMILTAKQEAYYEGAAVEAAWKSATDLPTGAKRGEKKLKGNLAWGNSSCQGNIGGNVINVSLGLKSVKKMFSDKPPDGVVINAKTIKFPSVTVAQNFRSKIREALSQTLLSNFNVL